MEWCTVNGTKYDQHQLTELAIKLNIIATRLSSISTAECIKFLSNIPCYKPPSENDTKNDIDISSIHKSKHFNKGDFTHTCDDNSHLTRYSNFCYNATQQTPTTNLPQSGWGFVKKCTNKLQRIRYRICLFYGKSEKNSLTKLISVERNGRYAGISYEELITPSNEKPDQPLQLNLDEFLNHKFETTKIDVVDGSDDLTTIKNAINGRQSNESISNVFHKEYKSLLNTEFSKQRPFLEPPLTFTKLYNLREKLFRLIDIVPMLDPATVAAGWVLFERLVVSKHVTASNRKLYAGVCLIISFKFYQDDTLNILSSLTNALQSLDPHSNITVRNIFSLELHIFTLLRFDLALDFSQVSSHLNHYLESRNMTFKEFYGMSPIA